MELLHTDSQVSLVELVGDVPPQRTELTPFLHKGVEIRQTEQHLLKLVLQNKTRELSVFEKLIAIYMRVKYE